MEISYFPGCTLKTKALNFEKTALALLELLDVKPVELKQWYCCGVSFSLSEDNLMLQLAPIRTLIKTKEAGSDRLLTLCSMCYNTLKRAQIFLKEDPERVKKVNDFMYRETTEYYGDEVEVVHILKLMEEVGAEKIKQNIKKKVNLKVAPYYGCLLLRPKEVAIDNSEQPQIMEQLLEVAGCEVVDFPFKTECCCSYQIVDKRGLVKKRTEKIINSAVKNGAEVIVLSCPLCGYNLDAVQKEIKEENPEFKTIPVLYFTQLLSLMAGLSPELNDFSLHYIDPKPILEREGLL